MSLSPPRGLTPAAFFALDLHEGDMTHAHRATGIAYSTIVRASSGRSVSVATALALASWSTGLDAARSAGVSIDAAVACGLVAPARRKRDAAVSR